MQQKKMKTIPGKIWKREEYLEDTDNSWNDSEKPERSWKHWKIHRKWKEIMKTEKIIGTVGYENEMPKRKTKNKDIQQTVKEDNRQENR